RGVIPFIILVLASGFWERGIDNWGHLGGLATGALLAFVIPPPRQTLVDAEIAEPSSQAIVALPIVVVLLALGATADHYRTMQSMDRLLVEGERFESAHQYDRAYQIYQQALRLAP